MSISGKVGAPAMAAAPADQLERLLTAGRAHRAAGRYPEAKAVLERALEVAEVAHGSASLEVAEVLNELGIAAKYAGRFADGEAAYGRALAIVERELGPEDDAVASLFHNLGGLAHARGDHEAAEPLARRSVELRTALWGPDDVQVALDRGAHAAILVELGRLTEAEAVLREVIDTLRRAPDDELETAVTLNNLATVRQRLGDLGEAELVAREALAIRERRLGQGSSVLALSWNTLGSILEEGGRLEQAVEHYERAIDLLEGAVVSEHPARRTIARNLERVREAAARS